MRALVFRGHRGGLESPLTPDQLRSEIQSDMCPPPEAYELRAALGDAIQVGGYHHQSYVDGTIRGSRITLRRYDDREDRRWAGWIRPKLVGSIEPHGDGSVVGYRTKLRPFWLLPAAFAVIGVVALGAGLYSLGRTHTAGPSAAIYTGSVFAVLGTALLVSLAAAVGGESAELEDWLAERCRRQTVKSPVISSEPAWYPDPRNGGWRWWTGYAWAAHADAPIPPIPDR
jgi:hypothetical protein